MLCLAPFAATVAYCTVTRLLFRELYSWCSAAAISSIMRRISRILSGIVGIIAIVYSPKCATNFIAARVHVNGFVSRALFACE